MTPTNAIDSLPSPFRTGFDDTIILTGTDAAPYLRDWTGDFQGQALAVLRPATTADVARIVQLCLETNLVIVPQGGNTGLVGGATPVTPHPAVVVQMGRMKAIRRVDPADNAVVVEAGCVLADLQAAARAEERLFPLSLGSEGTAQIGGLIATNAGGTMALRHGMMRDLVLGLEVVLADGQIWSDLGTLRKRNIGIDPKSLFIGAEGCTGIITAAALKLAPRPAATASAWLALASLEAGPELVSLAQARTGGAVDACELIPRQGMAFAIAHVPSVRAPLDPLPDWSVLVETSGPDRSRLDEDLMDFLEAAMERGIIVDGVVAASEAQRVGFWFLREAIVEGQRLAGPQAKHDVAVPVASVPTFIRKAGTAVHALAPEVLVSAFGHLGDGNIHFNLTLSRGALGDAERGKLSRAVYRSALDLGGTISAEHGLGRRKRGLALELGDTRGFPVDLLRALDPRRLMNPF